jgi:hypothetical protein
MGMPEYEAKRYEGQIRRGAILMSVHCDNSDWVRRAKDILEQTGAEDIASAGEARADFAKSDKPMPRRGVHREFENRAEEINRDRTFEENVDRRAELAHEDPLNGRKMGQS